MSFSAGQYFDVKIEYIELTEEEFLKKMSNFTTRLEKLFAEGKEMESEIKKQLRQVKYEC